MINTWPGWENCRLLGEGSFGKVYEIKREEFGVTYRAALKVISIPQSQSDIEAAYADGMDDESVTEYFCEFVKDIVAEFALMSQLKGNSNIVSYEDHMVVQHEDKIGWDILIRMELLTPLLTYCGKEGLSEKQVVKLGSDICKALELCRKKGIIHRDVKPENIFVSENGDFKLGDFGIARMVEKTMSGMSKKGTYNYMAPEVYRGEDYGFAADIYSLGIVLYRFLNQSRTPFLPQYPQPIKYEDRNHALMRRMAGESIPKPVLGDKTLREVVLKACAYRVQDRYATAEEFRLALEGRPENKQVVSLDSEPSHIEAVSKVEKQIITQPVEEDDMEATVSVFQDSKRTAQVGTPKQMEQKQKPKETKKVEKTITYSATPWYKATGVGMMVLMVMQAFVYCFANFFKLYMAQLARSPIVFCLIAIPCLWCADLFWKWIFGEKKKNVFRYIGIAGMLALLILVICMSIKIAIYVINMPLLLLVISFGILILPYPVIDMVCQKKNRKSFNQRIINYCIAFGVIVLFEIILNSIHGFKYCLYYGVDLSYISYYWEHGDKGLALAIKVIIPFVVAGISKVLGHKKNK